MGEGTIANSFSSEAGVTVNDSFSLEKYLLGLNEKINVKPVEGSDSSESTAVQY